MLKKKKKRPFGMVPAAYNRPQRVAVTGRAPLSREAYILLDAIKLVSKERLGAQQGLSSDLLQIVMLTPLKPPDPPKGGESLGKTNTRHVPTCLRVGNKNTG